jgi:hypothetical protein
MITENYYSKSMPNKSDAELHEYINHSTDYQEEAVLAAISELEKRGTASKIISDLKSILSGKIKAVETSNNNFFENSSQPLIYSSNFILIFGVLFSVFGAGILVALNFMQLKKIKKARLFLLTGLGYSLLQILIFSVFKTTSPLVSVASSLLGVYLLNYYSAKEMPTDLKSTPRNIWYAIMIGILISLPLAFFVIKMNGLQ